MMSFIGEEALRVMQYVDYLLIKFGLGMWTVVISDKPCAPTIEDDPAPAGQMITEDCRYTAILRLCKEWPDLACLVKQNVLVHEVLHLVTREMRSTNYGQASFLLPDPKVSGFFLNRFEEAEERLVDHLTGILSPMLPPFPLPADHVNEREARVYQEGDWI